MASGIVDRNVFAARGETAAVVDLFRVVGFRVSPLSGYLVILESFSHTAAAMGYVVSSSGTFSNDG